MPARISEHVLQRARALVRSGSSVAAAAAAVGCSTQTLYNHGIHSRPDQARSRFSRRVLDRAPAEGREPAARSAHPLDPLYGAVAEASIAVNCGGDVAAALRKAAAVAELLSLDQLVTQGRSA